MLKTDDTNLIFKLAADFVNNTSRHIFLTGKAGTGKTTFLKYIKEHTSKRTVVVAPTGVAAINAAGVTMHSFFNCPLARFYRLHNVALAIMITVFPISIVFLQTSGLMQTSVNCCRSWNY